MKLTVEINDKEFQYLQESCASQYWAELSNPSDKPVKVREHNREDHGDPGPWIELTEERRLKGLELMLAKAPKQFAAFISGQWDGGTADVWLQLAVLGEVKYG